MNKYLPLWLLLFSMSALLAQTSSPEIIGLVKPAIVPFLSFADLQALYPPKHHIGDWDLPKLGHSLPHQQDLIECCKQDLKLSVKANPDPLLMGYPLRSGTLRLFSINSDPDSRIIVFCFEYDSELVADLRIIYYYDPAQDRFILKSRL